MIRILAATTSTVFLLTTLFLVPTASAAECRGQSKTSCSARPDCSWVAPHTRKNGVKVKGFCRALPGKSSEKRKKAEKKASKTKRQSVEKAKRIDSDHKDKSKSTKPAKENKSSAKKMKKKASSKKSADQSKSKKKAKKKAKKKGLKSK